MNRPGLGQSSRKPDRCVSDDISDTRELLKHLGVGSFVAIGWSGGGARALGSSLIDGCRAVHTVAGICPQIPQDFESMAGLAEARIEQLKQLRSDYSEVLAERRASYEEDKNVSAEAALQILSQLPNYPNYKAEYRSFAEDFSRSIRTALANGPETDADDYFANINPWGFTLDQVQRPVTIWHGDADDNVRIARGEYNHRYLPDSRFIPLAGQGHVSIMVEPRKTILSAAIESLVG